MKDGQPRHSAFAQSGRISILDRLGRWLSVRRVRRLIGAVDGKDAIDIGAGFDAGLSRVLFARARSLIVTDLAIDPDIDRRAGWVRLEGRLPETLGNVGDSSVDIVLCNNVLEHLRDDGGALEEFHRILRPGGVAVINVPSWRGKWFLEFAAFRLGLAPFEEMDDHKRYYDPPNLWPILVSAGFRPHAISCRRHKFGLNTVARCQR